MKPICVSPKASALIESLRDIGYSLESALADIVDNSITAGAEKIEIWFNVDGDAPAIAIIDDGTGMDEDELIEAMRPGSISPLELRDRNDLGRFGLGLKTASFSQCRRLTVVSRKDGIEYGCRWDLEIVVKENDWLLQVLDKSEIDQVAFIEKMSPQGTLVLWEVLDRFIDQTGDKSIGNAYEKMDIARKHLELVFHRYLKGEPGIEKVSLSVNGNFLEGFDPFNAGHAATQILPKETITVNDETIVIQPYILPHHSKISKKNYEYYGGDEGYLKNQGFYVYRNARLLVKGTWFRLARQSELTKLARVRIDLPNNQDHLWNIDVKKSRANPPLVIKQRLEKIIEKITGRSTRVYVLKANKALNTELVSVWHRNAAHGEIFYTINRKHPLIEKFLNDLSTDARKEYEDQLTLIEGKFPMDTFFSDMSVSPENIAQSRFDQEKVLELASIMMHDLDKASDDADALLDFFKKTEPFRDFYDACAALVIKKEKDGQL